MGAAGRIASLAAAALAGCCFGGPSSPAAPTPPPLLPASPVASSAPPTLPTCDGARCPIVAATAVVGDGSTAFVATDRAIVAIDDGGTTARVIATTTTRSVTSIALSPTHVYWAELGAFEDDYAGALVARAPRAGGEREVLDHVPHFATQIAMDEHGVCWVTDMAMLRCGDADGHGAHDVFSPVVVYAIGTPDLVVQNDTGLGTVPRAGGTLTLLEPWGPMFPAATQLLRASDGIYAAEQTTLLSGGISRRALDGTGRVELAHGLWTPFAIALLEGRVLGAASQVGLVSVPRAGGTATLPVPHGVFDHHACVAVTDAWVWIVEGETPMAYRLPRAQIEAAATAPPAPL